MSFLDSVISKTVNSAMANNPSLPRITSTTFAEAGTSLKKIASDASTASISALGTMGITNSEVTRPITSMVNQAISLDPSQAGMYNLYGSSELSRLQTSFNSALPGVTNSVFDIQSTSASVLKNSVTSLASRMGSLNADVGATVAKVGNAALPKAQDFLNKASATSYNVAGASVTKSVSDMSKTIADKAQAALKATPASTVIPLPEVSTPTTGSSATLNTEISHKVVGSTTTSEDVSTRVSAVQNSTDIIYQEVKVYIEGVQVPFDSCAVHSAIGQFPRATIQIPPQAGLMDIARYYQPKVHIFYTDMNTGGDRILFNGHIVAVNYGHSQQGSSLNISYECLHKNALMQQLTFEWSAGGSSHATSNSDLLNNNPDQAAVQLNNVNSEAALLQALQGLNGVQSSVSDLLDPSNKDASADAILKLDKKFADFESRLVGMPSAMMNIWNQVKWTIFKNPSLNVIFTKVYLPLVEEGIQFFSRTSGHYYLEKIIDDSKVDHCNDTARPEMARKVMLPPAFRMNIMSAVQTQMVVNNLNSMLGFSGELMNFHDLFMNFYYGVEYEMLTLASPAEVPCDATKDFNADPSNTEEFMKMSRMAVETIVKPQIPFYYSPICNVILPNMYSSIQVSQVESDIPTRVTATSNAMGQAVNGSNAIGLNYRAPQSIRESVALGVSTVSGSGTTGTLRETTGSSYNLPGKYELGRGIVHKKIAMPGWLSHMASDGNEQRSAQSDEEAVIQGSIEDKNIANLQAAWANRYGSSEAVAKLNPFDPKSDIRAYERLLFSAADFEFTKDVVKSKTGGIDCIFNPYIIPGYPMDILNKNPNHPSFHAMCASVSHNFSSRSISTSVSFIAAITYTEMYNYFIQPIHPWLQTALNMVNVARSATKTSRVKASASLIDDTAILGAKPLASAPESTANNAVTGTDPLYDVNTGDVEAVVQGLVGNTRAKIVADQFYKSVLGVGAAEPSQMYDFSTGEVLAVSRKNGIWVEPEHVGHTDTANGGNANENHTGVGSLRLVSRQIEGRKGIESRFGVKFIDMTPGNYSGTPAKYTNDAVASNKALEPGASLFLDYEEISTFIAK